MKIIDKITHHLSAQVIAPYSMRLFSLLVYSWFIINVIMVWDTRNLLWGVDNVFYRQGRSDTLIENFFYQLIYDASRFRLIFFTHIVMALISLVERKWSFIPRLIAWVTGWILFYAAVEAFNSGMMLMLLLAFYCSVVYTKTASPFRNVVTNIARYACIIQVCLVYLFATIYKLSGEQWPAGDAMYYALHISRFSSQMWIDSWMIHSVFIMKAMTYLALVYQLLFPVMIWFKKGRGWFLFVGVAFHLFIGIFMHLWDFAFAMIFSYALFLGEDTAKKMMIFRTLRN